MKILFVILSIGLILNCHAQQLNNPIQKTEKQLTNGTQKSWIYYETIKSMGGRQVSELECDHDTITFIQETKTFTGFLCETDSLVGNNWKIEGNNPDEQFIYLGDKFYMLDIYSKPIDGEKVQLMRLKDLSKDKGEPSVGHVYKAL